MTKILLAALLHIGMPHEQHPAPVLHHPACHVQVIPAPHPFPRQPR